MNDLAAWLPQAWNDHAKQPQQVLDALAARWPDLPDAPEGAQALRLAEHVALAHLPQPQGAQTLRALLQTVPPHDQLAPAAAASRWALAALDGTESPPAADADRWRALQNLVLALAAQHRHEEASRWLLADEARAATAAPPTARAYAASANNVAQGLRLGPRGSAAADALMLQAAALSRRAWAAAGTWLEVERADYQLAMCHAAVGEGTQAQAHAATCIAACEAHAAAADERFFAHECAVHAARAAGDEAGAAAHRERMLTLLAQVEDAGTRQWCEETLAAL